MDQSQILVQKLDEFIRKYYKNQLLKGVIFSGAIVITAFLTVALLEYYGQFNSLIRGLLFFGFLFSALTVISYYIVIPLLKLNRIGKIISYDEAAEIIGRHFSHVQDKLLNVLQLQNNRSITGSEELWMAGIRQKISELQPIPFTTAIDLKQNRRHLKFLAPLLLIIFFILVVRPQILTKSTTRLVNYNTYYEKEMPFNFTILNNELSTVQTKDFKLDVKVSGEQIPNELFILINGIEYKFEKENKITFSYVFKNPQKNTAFELSAGGFNSHEYELKVLPKPTLVQFNIQLIYPAYLNKPSEILSNNGDLQIPQGTKVNWNFSTKNTEQILISFTDSSMRAQRSGEDKFSLSKRFMQSDHYSLKAYNSFIRQTTDSMNYSINVLPDQYPIIEVSEKKDSLDNRNIFFSGQIRDDHGFNKLTFHYTKYSTDSSGKVTEEQGMELLNVDRTQITQGYYHYFNMSGLSPKPGDKVEYYFEVYDNDGVNGSKPARTQTMVYKAPTQDEINEAVSKNNSEIKKDLEQTINKTKELQKDIDELSKKINDKKNLGYEEKKRLEDLLKKQNELKNKIEEIKQENQQNNQQKNEFSQTDESLLEKQKQLEQLFENVMTPEMKKLFDELQKMMERLDKNEVQQKLDEMKLSNKDIEKELDRNLEMFKQLEVQQKMQQAIEKLDELKKKEDDLNKATENKDNKDPGQKQDKQSKEEKNKELEKKQNEISKEFDKLKEDLKDLKEKNEALEEPNQLPKNEEKQNEVSKEMQKSSDELSKNNKKNASDAQKKAGEKMEEMMNDMQESMDQMEEKQDEENAAALRQILENLLNLSFAQEELIKQLPKTRIDNPQYVKIPQAQNKLKDDSKIIEDSLLALSKRAPQISAVVNREISAINMNMGKTVKSLAERNTGEAGMRMQSTMTSVNNLALLLNESLEQMQNEMKQQNQMQQKMQQGKGKCKKPGNASGKSASQKPSIPNMRQMQEQLNQQLKQLKDAMEKGQKPGEKPGDKKGQKQQGGMGQNGSSGSQMMPGNSEQLAKMAAQQEALRRQMQALMDKMKNKGKNPGGDIADLMEQTEKDIVNKQITNETMRRQQEILNRLLESEKAEREREQDEQRKSNEAKNENNSNPKEFLEYKRLKEKELELINTVPPSLTPFYKEKVNSYLNNVSNTNGTGKR